MFCVYFASRACAALWVGAAFAAGGIRCITKNLEIRCEGVLSALTLSLSPPRPDWALDCVGVWLLCARTSRRST